MRWLLALLVALALPATANFGAPQQWNAPSPGNLAAASLAIQVNEQDFGSIGSAGDNCLLLDMSASPAAGARVGMIRLNACFDHPAGSRIALGDTAETSNPYPQVSSETGLYVDTYGNLKWDANDTVFLTTIPSGGPNPSGPTGQWTLRLVARAGHLPGTLVFLGDSDVAGLRGHGVAVQASVGYVEKDNVTGLTAGDPVYFLPLAPGAAAGTAVPKGSILLSAGAAPATPPAAPPATPPAAPPVAPPAAPPAPPMTPSTPPAVPPATPEDRDPAEVPAPWPLALVAVALILAARRKSGI